MTEPTKDDDFQIAGREITGDLQLSSSRNSEPPATAAEFLEAVDAFLNIPGVYAARWRQYTPYFNDGDPCEFLVDDICVRLTPLDDEDDERGDYEDGFFASWSFKWNNDNDEISDMSEDSLQALNKAFEQWENLNIDEVARRNFGDHAVVTATLEGFNVEFYDHD